jgi:hypothetical protein
MGAPEAPGLPNKLTPASPKGVIAASPFKLFLRLPAVEVFSSVDGARPAFAVVVRHWQN